MRHLDQLKLKEIRFKDFVTNPDIQFMGLSELNKVKSSKSTLTQVYTFDFTGRLEMFNTNESQLMNFGHTQVDLRLNKTYLAS